MCHPSPPCQNLLSTNKTKQLLSLAHQCCPKTATKNKTIEMAIRHINEEKWEIVKELKLVYPGCQKAAQMNLIIGARQDKRLAVSEHPTDETKCYRSLSTLSVWFVGIVRESEQTSSSSGSRCVVSFFENSLKRFLEN